jgi:hypothetical protein
MADVTPDAAKSSGEETGEAKPKLIHAHISRTHTLCSARYYGSVKVDAPSSATEINRNVVKFRQAPHQEQVLEAILCIPRLTGGFIHLLHPQTRAVLMSVPVKHIVYCARSARMPDCIGFTSNYHEPSMVVSADASTFSEVDALKDAKKDARDDTPTPSKAEGDLSTVSAESLSGASPGSMSSQSAVGPVSPEDTAAAAAAAGKGAARKEEKPLSQAELVRQRNEQAWHLHRVRPSPFALTQQAPVYASCGASLCG